jgi:hypothetical protein
MSPGSAMSRDDGTASLIRSVEEVPLPSTVEGTLTVLRRVLAKPYVQSILLRTGYPIEVTWFRDVSDSLAVGEPEEDVDSVLARIPLEELQSGSELAVMLSEGMRSIEVDGMYPTHLFVGSIALFRNYLNLPKTPVFPREESTEYYRVMGLKMLEVTSLNEDVVVVCGSPVRLATRTEIGLGIKIGLA